MLDSLFPAEGFTISFLLFDHKGISRWSWGSIELL